jgi:hypothetical protein
MAAAGDAGRPVALGDSPLRSVFDSLAERMTTEIAPVVEVSGCSARLLDRVGRALDAAPQK